MKKLAALFICLTLVCACVFSSALPVFSRAYAEEPATIKVWFSQNDVENKILEQIAARFTEKTGIRIEVVARINVFDAKNDLVNNAEIDGRPDIVFMQAPDIGELVVSGYLLPLELSEETRSRFVPAATEAFSIGGKTYGVGYSVEAYGLIYNKNIISENELPKTWREFFKTAEQLTVKNADGSIAQYGTLLDSKDVWFNYPIIKNFGGYYYGLDENGGYDPSDVGYNNAGMVEYCEFIKSKMPTGIILTGENEAQSEIAAQFMKNNVAMTIYGLWTASYWKNAGVEYGISPLPANDDGTPSKPLTTVNGFVVNNFSLHKDEALAFLDYVLLDENQQLLMEAANGGEKKTGLRPPANLSVINSDYVQSSEILSGISEIGRECEPFPNIPEGGISNNYTTPALKAIFFDGADVQGKLDELAASILNDAANMNLTPQMVALPWYSWAILGATVFTAALVYALYRRKKSAELRYKESYQKSVTLLAWGLLTPLLALLGLFYLFPIAHNIYLSMTDYSGVNLRDYGFIGFYNYKQIFTEGLNGFASMLIWTLVFAFLVVAISFVFGTFIAVLLDKAKARIAKIYRLIFIFPWVIPSVITLLMWSGMLSNNGIIAGLFGFTGLLNNPWTARLWAVLVMIWFSFPYYMVVAFGFLKAIPKEYYEAAKVDGASSLKQFALITLPFVFKAILPTLIMGFIMQFNQFGVYILTAGGPSVGRLGDPGATDLLITYVFNLAFNSKRYSLAAAYSVLIFVFIAVFSIIAMRAGKVSKTER